MHGAARNHVHLDIERPKLFHVLFTLGFDHSPTKRTPVVSPLIAILPLFSGRASSAKFFGTSAARIKLRL